ncbi:MAG TPA: DUF2961 domain-containing protein [Armatimonadota bacterium]|jgi:hypothetical protein
MKTISILTLILTMTPAFAEPPPIPIGMDAFRQWQRWPYHRIGERAFMRSTYDRAGGNEGADASHFLYQEAEDRNVTLDVEGTGVLCFARYNHWHGSPWHYTVDGVDHIIAETSTADPNHPVEGSIFVPSELFPSPLAWTWSDTRGADLSWAPIPFEQSLKMAYSRTHYGTGYYIYHLYVPGTRLSQPIRSWDAATPPAQDVLDLLRRSGTDIAPKTGVTSISGTATVPANSEVRLAELSRAPSVIRRLEFSVPRSDAAAFSSVRLRIIWDNRPAPSVDAPVALFHGAGVLYNRDNREYLVKAFPVSIRYDAERVHLACYFPMPYFQSARISLVGAGREVADVRWNVRYARFTGKRSEAGYFHATYRDHSAPVRGEDLTLLDTRGIEGSNDWCGSLVGTSWIFSHNAVLNTLEGDPRYFFDDSESPQAQGTGTEEWGGGGDYWGGRTMTLPFAGHPCGAPSAKEARVPADRIESAYRFLLADAMPFGRNARIGLEHGGTNTSTEHYESVTYWYGAPGAYLVKTDAFRIGVPAAEAAHLYTSPQASEPYQVTSRYELGPDTLDGVEVYPATTKLARSTAGTSEFTVRLTPDNWGVLLRRTLDYAFANQRAEVYVADVSGPAKGKWAKAGVWYTAGSNTCVYSNPPGETDPARHVLQTSNRRFRDDEFLIGRTLTRGRKAIRIRVAFTPVNRAIYPGGPVQGTAWSEIAYNTYCFVVPTEGK